MSVSPMQTWRIINGLEIKYKRTKLALEHDEKGVQRTAEGYR
jgi:hypothetical protein